MIFYHTSAACKQTETHNSAHLPYLWTTSSPDTLHSNNLAAGSSVVPLALPSPAMQMFTVISQQLNTRFLHGSVNRTCLHIQLLHYKWNLWVTSGATDLTADWCVCKVGVLFLFPGEIAADVGEVFLKCGNYLVLMKLKSEWYYSEFWNAELENQGWDECKIRM